MDPEEERIRLLTRIERETVIKRGTYDMDKARQIIQDHPFYKKPEIAEDEPDESEAESMQVDSQDYYEEPVASSALEQPISDEDAAILAAQIMQNNFKTGMSQADVDSFLGSLI